MNDRGRTIADLLGFAERAEARLLSWGFYDVSFSAAELRQLVKTEGPSGLQEAVDYLESEEGVRFSDLIDEMQFDQLLFEVSTIPRRFRTRFAEAVRLFARLKQFFTEEEWNAGARLVADVRVHISPRRYPLRDTASADCWKDIEPHVEDVALLRPVFEELTQGLKLAGFQRRSLARIFREYATPKRSGTVISAGTGSGKTKGFYLPTLLRVAEDVRRDDAPFVKVVAIYPRNVLLADQLREAISELAKVNRHLQANAVRPLTIGALLGSTPSDHWFEKKGQRLRFESWNWCTWRRKRGGSVIPHLAGDEPSSRDLIWLDSDREANCTRLVDERGTERVADGVLRITREQLQQGPPDILFLSLEMLNRELGNSDWWPGLGVGQPPHRRPRMLLLDEVHAYEGIPGAMAAWVLRRWFYRVGASHIHVVGLSATLKDAAHHLSVMSSVWESRIEEIRPHEQELEAEGVEYSIALKGDPAAGAALLSTTIQGGMLLSRVLTPLDAATTGGLAQDFFGRKVFAFTDNLDVLNRWFQNMTDAEMRKRLAALRRTELGERGSVRDRDGQLWFLPESIGHDLRQSHRVTRCSSQDQGVDINSNLIVATSSLEVGYDDPEVGATLHHKRPTSMSSFVQRRGRAGRRRGMRPWTVMVLSDFATDRWAFQNIERYFEPEIDALRIPTENPYVLKAQGVMFLLDWLGQHLRAGSPYVFLGQARRHHGAKQARASEILADILEGGSMSERFLGDFEEFLTLAGFMTGDANRVLDAVLWEDPRPVLRHAIPKLLQTLEDWASPDPRSAEGASSATGRPLPTYIPGATFAELAAGDVELEFPDVERRDEVIQYTKGLREFCPGNVSKRYAVRQFEHGYWLQCSSVLVSGIEKLSIDQLFPNSVHLGTHLGVSCFRPVRLELAGCPKGISDRSTGFWEWNSELRSEGAAWDVPVFTQDHWRGTIGDVRAFMSREGGAIEVVRVATDFRYEVGPAGQDLPVRRTSLESEAGEAQGVAERRLADGLWARVYCPIIDLDDIERWGLLPSLRTEYYRYLARGELVDSDLNPFLADRVVETALAMLVATAAAQKCSLQEAAGFLRNQRPAAARKVLRTILRAGSDEMGEEPESRHADRIAAVWSDGAIRVRLEQLEAVLWNKLNDEFCKWLQRRTAETIGQAFRSAVLAVSSECADGELELDVVWSLEGTDIYMTETSPGGVGHVEQVVGAISADPDRFERAFGRALEVCPVDRIAQALRTVAELAAKRTQNWHAMLSEVRSATTFTEADQARRDLRELLVRSHLDATRTAVVSVVNRVARPGTNSLTDRIVHLANTYWTRLEERLGIGVDPSVFAYVLLNREAIRRRLEQALRDLGGGIKPSPSQLRTFLDQVLIVPCTDACRDCLEQPSRYEPRVRPDRSLAAAVGLLPPDVSIAEFAESNWPTELRRALTERGEARLHWTEGRGDAHSLMAELFGVLAEPVDAGTILLPVAITALEPDHGDWTLTASARSASR